MALQKQQVQINFAQGLDTKTDPKQVQAGKFLTLSNSVFQKGGLLTKRNGFGALPALPNLNSTNLTTFNSNLIAIGTTLQALSPDTGVWYEKGVIQPLELTVQAVIRTSHSQTTVDIAYAPNGLNCVVYMELGVSYYAVTDGSTQQMLIDITALETGASLPRVFSIGNYFYITYLVLVGATPHLRYIYIPIFGLLTPSAPIDISTEVSSITAGYDGIVANNFLYLAWDGSDVGHAIRATFITSTHLAGPTIIITGHTSTLMSVTADLTVSPPNIWITFWDESDDNGFTTVYNGTLNTVPILAPTQVITGVILQALTSTAQALVNTIFYETAHDYTYEAVRTDFTSTITCTQSGVVGTPIIILRGVGLASKSFYFPPNNLLYVLVTYAGAFQPTYFLIDQNGNVIAKVAYSNGGGYMTTEILPSVNVNGNLVSLGYLFADTIVPVNKTQGSTNVSGIHAQTGINTVTFNINNTTLTTSEIANDLHITGGFLWMYDRVKPVEHQFHVWPEDILAVPSSTGGGLSVQQYFYQFCYEWTDGNGNIHRSAPSVPFEMDLTALPGTLFTSIFDSGVTQITVSSAAGLSVGQVITDITTPSVLLPNTQIIALSGVTLTLNQATQNPSNPTPGDTLSAVAGTPLTFDAVFPINSLTMTVNSASGLHVGQIITDTTTPANFTPGTVIAGISGLTVTLNQPTAGASIATPGDLMSTNDTFSAIINVPTYRQTYKAGPNPVSTALNPIGTNPVRIVGYRWSENLQIYYQFTPIDTPYINNPTVDSIVITDTFNDAEIIGNVILYTFGGIVEDIAAPACQVLTLFKTRLFLLDSEDRNLLWFSKQVIESVPVEMSDLFTLYVAPTISAEGSTGPITAISAMDDKLIVFKGNAIYYLTGDGPDNTGANSDYGDFIFITSTVGCSNQESIVFMPQGLMFQSNKGIWLLGRDLNTTYIGAPVEAFNSATVESALNIPATNQVRFTLDDGTTLMYDYYYSQWGSFSNIPGVSSCIYQSLHTYQDQYGQIFQETEGLYLDGANPVLMDFTTSWINLMGVDGYNRAYFFFLLGQYVTPHFLNVAVSYDFNDDPVQTTLILPINFNPNYGYGSALYGDNSPYGGNSQVENWRVFFQRQKCKTFKLRITEVYDSSMGVPAGEGLTLTGLNIIIGGKSVYPRLPATEYTG